MIRVFTTFSGYDSQCLALDRLGIDYELVGWSEIDKYAIQAHNALYPQWADRNFGDITKIDWHNVPDIDLLTYSSPCQDFSVAGRMLGGEKGSGTRSSLLWHIEEAISIKRPKYLLMENVANLVSSKYIRTFNAWQALVEGYGYDNYAQVLNAKGYGVPQNRERVFLVSVRRDAGERYFFPKPFELERRLKDVLEVNVDAKYYIHKPIKAIASASVADRPRVVGLVDSESGYENGARIYDTNNISSCLQCPKGQSRLVKIAEPKVLTHRRSEYGKSVRKAYEAGQLKQSRHEMEELVPREDGVCNTLTSVQKDNLLIEPRIIASRGRGVNNRQHLEPRSDGVSNTLTTIQKDNMVQLTDYRIRNLTPRECFRLMGCDEKTIDTLLSAGISNAQLYKLAGNSIVVDVLYHIFRKMFVEKDNENQQLTLF